jgi:hypothetical protein
VALGQSSSWEGPLFRDTANADSNLAERCAKLRRESIRLDFEGEEWQPIAVGPCPEHWRTNKHRARNGWLQRRHEEAVISTPWCAKGGEGGVTAEPVAKQQLALLRAR